MFIYVLLPDVAIIIEATMRNVGNLICERMHCDHMFETPDLE